MMRVLFIARYRDATMHRKVELLAQIPDLDVCYVFPRFWKDELVQVEQSASVGSNVRQKAISMWGHTSDPHRALYRTCTFEMGRFQPHIIHAEEEPDSLTALQIVLAKRILAPTAKLMLYTWQNIDRPKRGYVKVVMRATLEASDSVLCANQEAADILRRHGYTRPTPVLPAIGVDTRTFAPASAQTENKVFAIGYVGRLVPEKGLDTLIEAVKQLVSLNGSARHTRLVIIGDGPHRAALEAQAAALTHSVQFVPPMPPSQVAQRMGMLSALVLPSRTTPVWKEQFGRVLVEAMACKVPVIGSDSGAIPQVIGDAGFIFPEGDAVALAHCLHRLIESPALRHDLAERGYARVQQLYTQERIAQQTEDLYRQIISTHPSHAHLS